MSELTVLSSDRLKHYLTRASDLAYASTAGAKRALWSLLLQGDRVRQLEEEIRSASPAGPGSWYYFIDFGYGVSVRPELRRDPFSGEKNWRLFLSQHLPDLKGKRILDVGCNAGLYALNMVEAGAAEVVGLEFDTRQAEFVREWFSEVNRQDYSRVKYVSVDVTRFDLASLGRFDLVCMFSVAYHLGAAIEEVMTQVSHMTEVLAMQGNTPRLTGAKYKNRPHQQVAGVPGMKEILIGHGFSEIEVIAPNGHLRPLVIGRAPSRRRSERRTGELAAHVS